MHEHSMKDHGMLTPYKSKTSYTLTEVFCNDFSSIVKIFKCNMVYKNCDDLIVILKAVISHLQQ